MSKQHCRILQVERFFYFDKVEYCIEISSFRQRHKLNMFNLFRFRRKYEISFDIVAKNGNIVAKNVSNVETTFDFVKKTKFCDKLVGHCCRFWQQSRMLPLQRYWRGRALIHHNRYFKQNYQ